MCLEFESRAVTYTERVNPMRIFLCILLFTLAGCDLGSGDPVQDQIRADALSRAASDCGAANSCRISFARNGDHWVVTVSPTAIGISGDPQFNSGAVHHYEYDGTGNFVNELSDP